MTASVAEAFLKPETARAIKQVLRGNNLTGVASWADEIKRQPRYRWTSTLHYSNPKDDEPAQCGYDYQRDCPDQKCVVGAIFNFTAVYDPQRQHSADVREEALKFLVHFVGDMHQPLHSMH